MIYTKGIRNGIRSLFRRGGRLPVSGKTAVIPHWLKCFEFERRGIAFPRPGETYAQMVKRCADENSPLIIGGGDGMTMLQEEFGIKTK
jgi:hypothetical protein